MWSLSSTAALISQPGSLSTHTRAHQQQSKSDSQEQGRSSPPQLPETTLNSNRRYYSVIWIQSSNRCEVSTDGKIPTEGTKESSSPA